MILLNCAAAQGENTGISELSFAEVIYWTPFLQKDCHSSCQTCVDFGPESCTSCRDGGLGIIDSFLKTGTCACPNGTFSIGNGRCESKEFFLNDSYTLLGCHTNCSTCYGPTEKDCIECAFKDFIVNSEGLCSCPPETYRNANDTCVGNPSLIKL